jgi:hypothetical protein
MRADRTGSATVTRTLWVRAPWAILLLTAALVMAKLWLFAPLMGDFPPSQRITELLFQLLPVLFAAVGALIAGRRPGHRIGWLLLAGTLAIASAQLTWSYVSYSLSSGTPLPGAAIVGWVGNWIPWPALAAFALLLLLFPDGQLPSPRWRPVAWAMVALCAVIMAFLAGSSAPPTWRIHFPPRVAAPGLGQGPERDRDRGCGVGDRVRHRDRRAALSAV